MKKQTKKVVEVKAEPVEQVVGEKNFDYKNVASLTKYVSERGRIIPRSRSGLEAKEQRRLAQAVKRARMIGLLPFAD